jgi:Lon-like protease
VTRRTWTALLAAVLFVALAAALALVPAPYVTWTPGDTTDTLGTVDSDPVVQIANGSTYPTSGRLDLTTVSVTRPDSWVSLPEAAAAYWLPRRDALPREWVYPDGVSANQLRQNQLTQMDAARDLAIVAALKAAGIEVTKVPSVEEVAEDGPADGILEPGDLILEIDNRAVKDVNDVQARINSLSPGSRATFSIVRKRIPRALSVDLATNPRRPRDPYAGFTTGIGYLYKPEVSVDVGRRIGGPSAGLILALAIYDKVTPGALLEGRHVAGTGTIDDAGNVGRISGIEQKLAAAERAGAEIFLAPAANCVDLAGVRTDLLIVKVRTLSDAIQHLSALTRPGSEDQIPRC